MPYPRGRHVSWIVALVVAACSDAPTTVPLPPPTDAGAEELNLLFPAFQRDLLVTRKLETLDEPPSGPASAIVAPEEENPIEQPDYPEDEAGIFDARTFVYFNTDHVFAQGEHRYIGNKSRIETTAKAYFEGSLIGSQMGVKEQSSIFLLSGLYTQYIQAIARIYTDRTCGLAADASSEHSAWWEAVMGSPVSTFSREATSSFATRRYQPECSAPNDSGDGGGGSSGGMCYVNVWYDESTGEIVDWEVLFCENAYGG